MTTTKVLISGKVQGVFFRAQTKEKADQLALKGWVRNTPDAKVEAVFQGPEEKIAVMIKWCWQGPSASEVKKVSVIKEKNEKELFRGFEIRY